MSIRMATPADLPQILEIYAPYVLNTTVSFEYTVPTMTEFTQRFCAVTAQFPWLVWEENGCIFGYAYASLPFQRAAYHWCADSSIYLRPDAQGRGIGKALCQALEELLRLQGYRTLYAIITAENQRSLDFHHALGYTPVARFPACGFKFGRWLDTVWLQKRLNAVEMPSHTPVPIGSIVKNDRIFHEVLDKMSLS